MTCNNHGIVIFLLHLTINKVKVLTLSIASAQPSGKGAALRKSRLCLLGDLERHVMVDSSVTVSL